MGRFSSRDSAPRTRVPQPCHITRSTTVNEGSYQSRCASDVRILQSWSDLGTLATDHVRPYKAVVESSRWLESNRGLRAGAEPPCGPCVGQRVRLPHRATGEGQRQHRERYRDARTLVTWGGRRLRASAGRPKGPTDRLSKVQVPKVRACVGLCRGRRTSSSSPTAGTGPATVRCACSRWWRRCGRGSPGPGDWSVHAIRRAGLTILETKCVPVLPSPSAPAC